MERVFGTLQKRLPQELRLARQDDGGGNRYLKERFVPDYNARFAVPAADPGSAFIRYVGRPIGDVRCIQEDRVVAPTTASPGTGAACSFRHSNIAGTMCARPCVCTNTPTAAWLSSTARAVLHASTRRLAFVMSSLRPLNSARRSKACGFVDRPRAFPQAPQAQQQQQKRTFDVLQTADIFTRYGR
jgi:hypothetical protein